MIAARKKIEAFKILAYKTLMKINRIEIISNKEVLNPLNIDTDLLTTTERCKIKYHDQIMRDNKDEVTINIAG